MCVGYTLISAIINKLTIWLAFSETYKLANQIFNSKLIILIIIMSIIYIFLFAFKKRISKYRYLLVSISIILVILIGATGFIYVINNVVEQNMGLFTNRGFIWHYTNEVIKGNLMFGFGPDNFFYNFPQINPDKAVYMADVLVDKPHNMYLQVISDIGIIGFAGFMLLLIGLLLKLNKNIDIETDLYKNTYSKALMLVIFSYMLQGLVNDNHLVIQPILYLILGIGAAITTNVKIFNFGKSSKNS